ncbi:hypothetical protein RvY_04045 [Ramazzottius varieornatus]|uniref:Uncharacterized protein n=1 Tax=Ramazzottius varieornatus TaxID=947166 RepID=A0A1D1V0A4_RAMVA|nr:hypothetical protein RvY_04045 [Ramazzottius varieornatus]
MRYLASYYFSLVSVVCFAFLLSWSVQPVGSQAPLSPAPSGKQISASGTAGSSSGLNTASSSQNYGSAPGSNNPTAPAGNAPQGPALAPPPAAAPAPAPAPQQAQLQPILGISGAVEAKLNLTISVGKRRRRQV